MELLFALDCINRNGKYYLYFCLDNGNERAVSERPEDIFNNAVRLSYAGIAPAVFVNGKAYYYWGRFPPVVSC